MAPLTHQLRVLGEPGLCPPVLGPGLPELASAWHKLYLYSLIGEGPPSLLIPKVSLNITYNDNITFPTFVSGLEDALPPSRPLLGLEPPGDLLGPRVQRGRHTECA